MMTPFVPLIAAIVVSLAAAYFRLRLVTWTIAVVVAILAAGWLAGSSTLAIVATLVVFALIAVPLNLVEFRRRKVTAPLLAIWGGRGTVGALYDVLATWREKATHVEGRALDCGHTLQEELPDETLAELERFFLA